MGFFLMDSGRFHVEYLQTKTYLSLQLLQFYNLRGSDQSFRLIYGSQVKVVYFSSVHPSWNPLNISGRWLDESTSMPE